MAKTLADLKVGDTVWIGDVNARGDLRIGTVQKVGRKLITAESRVFRLDTGYENDGYSHRWLIPDLEAFQERKERNKLWVDARSTGGLHPDVTLADLREVLRLLRIQA